MIAEDKLVRLTIEPPGRFTAISWAMRRFMGQRLVSRRSPRKTHRASALAIHGYRQGLLNRGQISTRNSAVGKGSWHQ
jgi:hypothetical protein